MEIGVNAWNEPVQENLIWTRMKTDQKGTDDEIAICYNEKMNGLRCYGLFPVCPYHFL